MRLPRQFVIFFSFFCGYCLCQPYASTKGSFQVSQKQGCAPLSIALTQLIPASFTAEYNYEGGNTFTLSKTHTFNQPGVYTLLAVYNGPIPGSTDNSDNITITVTENIQPEFEMSSCSSGAVSVKVLDSRYSQYLVDFNNDNAVDKTIPLGGAQTETFQYTSLANQTITVRGRDLNGADNCLKQSQTFTPLASLTPATINAITITNATTVQIDYTPTADIQYRGVVATDNGSTFQTFQTFNSTTNAPQSITQTSLAADDHYYCFRLNAYDPCNNTNVPSNTVCSLNFDLTLASDVNQLKWTTALAGVDSFTVRRDQSDYRNLTTTSYNDQAPDIVCNTAYCYAAVANYPNGVKSISLEKCGTSFSTQIPSAIENATAAVHGDALDLVWVQDPLFKPKLYSINRATIPGPFSSVGMSIPPSYTDNTYSASARFCYHITYQDVCDNQSPDGNLICPMVVGGALTKENFVELTWTEYKGWKDGVKEYQVIQYDINGDSVTAYTLSGLTLMDNTNDPELQYVQYIVVAVPNDPSLPSAVSNRVEFTKVARLIFPNAFTPNGDNLNDTFTVIGQYVENMKLQIFDRWGTLLFSTENSEPWNGTLIGQLMPESTYVWKAFITDKTGNTSTRTGMVALLRK